MRNCLKLLFSLFIILGALLFSLSGISTANVAPVAQDDTATTYENNSVSIAVLGNDTDVDGDELYAINCSDPSHGSASAEGSYVVYTPDTGYSGTDSFQYTVTDWRKDNGRVGNEHSAHMSTATISVTITEIVVSPDQGNAAISDLSMWPLWPDQTEVSDRPNAPLSFTSVGRNVIASVSFIKPSNSLSAWGGNLNVLRKEDETAFPTLAVDHELGNTGYGLRFFDTDNENLIKIKDNESISIRMKPTLRDISVTPEYVENWFYFQDEEDPEGEPEEFYANQEFYTDWLINWYTFLEGTDTSLKAGEILADSGHAPPLLVWKTNYWITRFVDPDGLPEDWPEDEPVVFLPTNDGLLNKLDIDDPDTDPYVKRNWAVIPEPALRTAPYQENLNAILGYYPRLTNLDGPIFVHDVQEDGSDGEWKRILIGTSGLGIHLKNKVLSGWREELQDYNLAPAEEELEPALQVGKNFAIYAFDVTDPDNPIFLWEQTNIFWDRDKESENFSSSNPRDLYLDYVCARPLIGLTGEKGNLDWHALIVGMEYDEDYGTYYYHWYDLDPLTGNIKGHKRFTDQYSGNDETLWYILNGEWSAEDWDPTRMLAAYPKEPNQYGGLPVLSDVYVYLSNGSCYLWNIQAGNDPWKLFSTVTNISTHNTNPAPPLQDFDIAYFDEQGESGIETHTYMAAVLEIDFNASNPHDTTNLFVLDMESALGDYMAEDYEPKILAFQSAQGQAGETVTMVKDRIDGGNFEIDDSFEVELQTGNGANADEFEKLVATPLFLDGVLYLAVYSTTAEDGIGLSRLYTLEMDDLLDSQVNGASTKLTEGEDGDYVDFPGEEFVAATVGSDGVLYIPKTDGTVYSKDLGIEFGITEDSGDVSADFADTVQVYWRVRN